MQPPWQDPSPLRLGSAPIIPRAFSELQVRGRSGEGNRKGDERKEEGGHKAGGERVEDKEGEEEKEQEWIADDTSRNDRT